MEGGAGSRASGIEGVDERSMHRVGATDKAALAVAEEVDAVSLWIGNIPESCCTEEVLRQSLRTWLSKEGKLAHVAPGEGETSLQGGSDGFSHCTVRKKPGTKEKPNASWALMSFVDSAAMLRASVAKMVVTCPVTGERAAVVVKPSQAKHRLERRVRRKARSLSVDVGALADTLVFHSGNLLEQEALQEEEVPADSAPQQPSAPQPEPKPEVEALAEVEPEPQSDSLLQATLWLGNIPVEFAEEHGVSRVLADGGVRGVIKCSVRQKPDSAEKKHRSWAFVDFADVALKDAAARTTVSVQTVCGAVELKWAPAILNREQGNKEAVLVAHLLSVHTCKWTVPPLPRGKSYHFFLCHHQSSGGDQASLLYEGLTARGFGVWYDNSQQGTHRNIEGMKKGVEESLCLLLFLSGRKETDGQPDINGQYEGLFTRWFCHEEMSTAHAAQLRCIGVKETDARKGEPDMVLEKQRALSAGCEGQPVHPDAAANVRLLHDVCFIPFRREKHEKEAMLNEVVRQIPSAPVLQKRVQITGIAEGTPPESTAEPHDDSQTSEELGGACGPPPDDAGGVYAHLISMKLLSTHASAYALKLIAEGYDTAEAVEALSLEELKDEFGFKNGHLRMVELHRNAALGAVVPSLTATAATTTVAKPSAGR